MSDPFQAPASDSQGPSLPNADGVVSQLSQMRGWQKLIGWVFTILGVIMAIGSLLMLFVTMVADPSTLWMAPVYLISALLYFRLGASLRNSAHHIQQAVLADHSEQSDHVEHSLRHQADFWRVSGIVTAILLGIYGLLLALVFFAGLLGALAR